MELPKNLISLYENARKNINNEDYNKALKQLNEALNIEPSYAEAMILLVLVHSFLDFKKMPKDKALKVIERALNLKSESSIIWVDLGRFYSGLKDYEKAIECINKSIEIDPQYKDAYYGLGWIYHKLKDDEKAIECINKSIEIDPQYKNAYCSLGWIYDELENYEKAIECYNKCIEINPQHKEAYYALGVIYHKLKDDERAIEYFNKTVEIEPNNKDAIQSLVHIYSQSDNSQKAIEFSQKLLKLDSNFAELFAQNLPKKIQTSMNQASQKLGTILNKQKSTLDKIVRAFYTFETLEIVKQEIESSEKKYRSFRNMQLKIKEGVKKYPNGGLFQKLSKLNLSNISKIIPEVLEDLEDTKLWDSFNKLKMSEITSFIPWDMRFKIKKTTINLGVKYPRLQIQEIAEKCESPQDCVIVVLREMIKSEEIYADYFESTQFVVFDQKTNLDETENIQNRFIVWEKTTCKKCGMKIKEISQKICEYCGLDL